MRCTGLVAPRHVGSSRARARTRVPCTGRRILNHCTTREVLLSFSFSSYSGKSRRAAWCQPSAVALSQIASPPAQPFCLYADGSKPPTSPPDSPPVSVPYFRLSAGHVHWMIHHHFQLTSASSSPKLPPRPDVASLWSRGHLVLVPRLSQVWFHLLSFFHTQTLSPHFLQFQLCPHGVASCEIRGQATKFLLDLYKQNSSRSSERKSNLNHKNRKSWPLSQFPDLDQFTEPGPLE